MVRASNTARHVKIREVLIQLRTRTGLTQTDLAGLLKRPQSFVSKYERGARRLDVVELLEILGALDVSVCDFLNLIGE